MDNKIISSEYIKAHYDALDDKKQQTTYKIEYITKYVEKWLFVVINVQENQNINFIDCMCNAGIYKDGDFCSSIRVLELFNRVADNYPDKVFNILLNDYNENRISIIRDIINNIGHKKNVHCYTSTLDVNTFLQNDDVFKRVFNCYPKRSANLLFADPYNFCTVKISTLKKFLQNHYCELLFNVFTSDFVRNVDKQKMQAFCKNENITARNKEDLILFIRNTLKVGKIKYSFSYEFKTKTKNEIYQIMFFTPSAKGLEKLKEALWDTFKGKEFHQNKDVQEGGMQLSLFSPNEDIEMYAKYYATDAIHIICDSFKGQEKSYKEIELFIIENTLLKEGQVIEYIIKPLIKDKRIEKLNITKKSNYKLDKYKFIK